MLETWYLIAMIHQGASVQYCGGLKRKGAAMTDGEVRVRCAEWNSFHSPCKASHNSCDLTSCEPFHRNASSLGKHCAVPPSQAWLQSCSRKITHNYYTDIRQFIPQLVSNTIHTDHTFLAILKLVYLVMLEGTPVAWNLR